MIDIGNAQIVGQRENQEDYFATLPIAQGILCIVADGMGGYEGGEIASRICVKEFIESFKLNLKEDKYLNTMFSDSLQHIHNYLKSEIKKNPTLEDMGSTIISVLIREDSIMWINVGDSPMYRIRDNQLQRINANHSVAGDLEFKLNNGEISQYEFDTNEEKHMLTSAITSDDIPIIEFQDSFMKVNEDDIYILASDGIHSISDEEIINVVLDSNTSAQEIAQNLIDAVEQKNIQHQDNTTVIVAKIDTKG
jgi:protein phosphatase